MLFLSDIRSPKVNGDFCVGMEASVKMMEPSYSREYGVSQNSYSLINSYLNSEIVLGIFTYASQKLHFCVSSQFQLGI